MNPLVLPLPGSEPAAAAVAEALGAPLGEVALHRFPDGESLVRLDAEPAGQDVVVVASLHQPDPKVVPLRLLLETTRELGARRVVLVVPYLPYLRQDRRFRRGEAVSAVIFPRLLAPVIDGLVTVDPHLHRVPSLDAVWLTRCRVVHAAPHLAGWIAAHVPRPLIVGPDVESEQWVADVAARADAPHVVLEKERHGDHDVTVHLPDVDAWRGRTPVLVDDILSTGVTMATAVTRLREAGLSPPICLAVHALFAEGAEARLRAAGAADVVTCDTVPHATSRVSLGAALAEAAAELL